MVTDFMKMVERQMLAWFGKRLDDKVELDDVWDIIDDIVTDVVGSLDMRAQSAGWNSAEEWWNNGGRVYSKHASRTFAKHLNRKGGNQKTPGDVDDALRAAKAELDTLLRALRKKQTTAVEAAMAPVLCEGT